MNSMLPPRSKLGWPEIACWFQLLAAALGLVFVGSPARAQSNSPLSALRFPGGNKYAYINAPLINSNQSFVIEFWARRERGHATEHLAALGLVNQTNQSLRISFRPDDALAFSFGGNDLVAANAASDTNWHHWAFVLDTVNRSRRILRDGVRIAADSTLGAVATDGKFAFAGDIVSTNGFVGSIDEMRIWNIPVPDATIASRRLTPLTGQESGLVAYYRCDQVVNGNVPDATTNGRPLSLSAGGSRVPSGAIFLPAIRLEPPGTVTRQSVTLQGTVAPASVATGAWFEWGTNTSDWVNRSPVEFLGNGSNAVRVSVVVSNLAPTVLPFGRLCASNSAGLISSPPMPFRPGGATLTVTTLADSGPGSLRQQVIESLPGDTIRLAVNGVITLSNGSISIGHDLNLQGPGVNALIIDGGQSTRLLDVTNGVVTMADLNWGGGSADEVGGIWVGPAAELQMERCLVTRCREKSAGGGAGGILSFGRLRLTDCTIVQNRTLHGDGGGLRVQDSKAFFTNCTFMLNQAARGGAIASTGQRTNSEAWFYQCTFSQNTADLSGGAIFTTAVRPYYGEALIIRCTVATNTAPDAGVVSESALAMVACIFSGNKDRNLVNHGDTTEWSACLSSDTSVPDDVHHPGLNGVDPLLMPLSDNGGFTATHALRPGSPAIGRIESVPLYPAFDQRHWPRPTDQPTEVGAVAFHPSFTARHGSNNAWNLYVLVNKPTSWTNAEAAAGRALFRGANGHLITIGSDDENEFCSRLSGLNPTWIGLTANPQFGGSPPGTNQTSSWVWSNGDPFSFAAFGPGQPSGSAEEDAVAFNPATKAWISQRSRPDGTNQVEWPYVIEFETRDPNFLPPSTPSAPWLPERLRPEFTGRDGRFEVLETRERSNVQTVSQAAAALASPTGEVRRGVMPAVNVRDPDNPGKLISFGVGASVLTDTPGVDDDHIQCLFKGRIRVTAAQQGDWTFGVASDDGFALRIVGQAWKRGYGRGFVDPADPSVLVYPFPTVDSDTRGLIHLDAGDYDLELVYFEVGGQASCKLYAARGDYPAVDSTLNWSLVGASGALPLISPIARGDALAFHGTNGAVSIPHRAEQNTLPLTLTTWFRTRQITSDHRGLIGKYAPSSLNGYQLLLYNGNLRAWYFAGNNQGWIWDGDSGLNAGFVADDRWHHAAFVVDASGGRLYLDGRLRDHREWSGSNAASTSTEPIRLGSYEGRYFSGQLDEISLWKRALSDDELIARVFVPPSTTDPDLLGSWRCQESPGTVLFEATTNRWHGTISGGVTRAPSTVMERYPVTNPANTGPGTLKDLLLAVPGATVTLPSSNLVLRSPNSIVLSNSVRLEGTGNRRATLWVGGAGPESVLSVSDGTHLQLDNLQLTSVTAPGPGVLRDSLLHIDGNLTATRTILSNNVTHMNTGGIMVTASGWASLNNCSLVGNVLEGNSGFGGAMTVAGSARLKACTLKENSGNFGGAIGLYPSATNSVLELVGCALTANRASQVGGALYSNIGQDESSMTLRLTNCTMSGNFAGSAAAIYTRAPGALIHCTIYDNTNSSSSGALTANEGTIQLGNSIVGGSRSLAGTLATDLTGSFDSLGGNIIFNRGTATLTNQTPMDRYGVDPALAPLSANGAPTLTHALLPDSPARDFGVQTFALPKTDQRGQLRIRSSAPDVGAFEYCLYEATVASTADHGPGSLREALGEISWGGLVRFATNIYGQTITLTSGPIAVATSVRIDGPGARRLTVSGNSSSRILDLLEGIVTLTGLSFVDGRSPTQGDATNQSGGAIRSVASLTVYQCYFASNSAGFCGGAIAQLPNNSRNSAAIIDSTFTRNQVRSNGNGNAFSQGLTGGLEPSGSSIVQRCTFFANQPAPDQLGGGLWGGGVCNLSGRLELDECTFSDNLADYGGGVYNFQGTVTVRNSIIAGNGGLVRGPDVDMSSTAESGTGDVRSLGHNLIGNAAGMANRIFGAADSGDIVGSAVQPIDPLLGPLADNGGPTPTLALLPGSPALDAGDPSYPESFDQRGSPRVAGAGMDIGAYEQLQPIVVRLVRDQGELALRFHAPASGTYVVLASDDLARPFNTWTELGHAYFVDEPVDSYLPREYGFIPPETTALPWRYFAIALR